MIGAKRPLCEVLCDSSLSTTEGSALLGTEALCLHLRKLNYPETSINSFLRCGTLNGEVLKQCSCGSEIVQSKHKCNLRVCPVCSRRRKERIRNQYYPFLNSLAQDKKYFLYFLTISPENYEDLSQGLKEIRKNFRKFVRLDYVKDRLKLGIYNIEAKKVYEGDAYYSKEGEIK